MSGHSKWATIHRQKGVKDAARGQLFSKLARAITLAVKTGGGPNPDTNYKLRVTIDKAREANLPKENIERAISKGGGAENLEEITYEGFGPQGIALMIEAATDNRNRTGQEIKNILEKVGGGLGGPGSVSFNFAPRGFLLVAKELDVEGQMLKLIDLGVEDVEETQTEIECFTAPIKVFEVQKKVQDAGFKVTTVELIQKPLNKLKVEDSILAKKVLGLLETLDEQDDVQKVFSTADIPDNLISNE